LLRCRQARERFERKWNELRVECQRKDDRVEELEEALQKESREDGELEVLQTTLREAEEDKELNEGQLTDSATAMNEMMQNLKAIRQELAAKEADIARLREELKVAESEQHLITDKRRKRISEKNTAVEHISGIKRATEKLWRKKEEIVARILEFSEKANMVSPRVEIAQGETKTSLEKKYDKLRKDQDRYSREYVGQNSLLIHQLTNNYPGWEARGMKSLPK
jgi:ATP-dependent RNA helicase DDX6/DHH1